MRLVLYSGGYGKENRALAAEVRELLSDRRDPVITFVPGLADDAEADFRDFRRNIAGSGVRRVRYICIDEEMSAQDEARLLASDAIFLGGGNTFYILHHLRQRKLLTKLRAFVKRGGVLMGLSAGSILMTPSVDTAQVPNIHPDDNYLGLTDFRGLGLVPFEFSPHYEPSRKADRELLEHSKNAKAPIYACSDGQGIVVRDGNLQFVGNVTVFHRGAKYRLH